ncbi:MAG TPA: hypothetical protein VN982_03830 [Candidatus Dormibacteraeota bacterium]|nr:hypothetical protein [Candidatus Dormibacteraeota bacterium]
MKPSNITNLASVLLIAAFMAACSNTGSVPPLPPPVGMYSNASLKGQYAFSMSGEIPSTFGGSPISRVGSFVADGNGNITSAIEDVQSLSSTSTLNPLNFATGAYSILPDGRGTITLGSGSSSLVLDVVLTSTTQGLVIQINGAATSSGSFIKTTPGAFSAASFNGNYVFDVSGVSAPSGFLPAPMSLMGRVTADGNSKITAGVLDENDGNQSTVSGPINSGVTGTFQLDSQFGANFGRGLLTLKYTAYSTAITRTFAFYIVDGTRIKWLEEDNLAITVGDAVKQSASVAANNSAFTGSFVYLVTGAVGASPLARVARFTADGAGNLSQIALDENLNGNHNSITATSAITGAHYEIDTANAGSGRGTFTFTDSQLGKFDAIFYLMSPAQAAVQDTSRNLISDGTMLAQNPGPITSASLAGNYAFNWSGVIRATQTFPEFEEDFLGQHILTGTGIVTGAIDYVELAFLGNPINFDIPLAGSLTINGDGTASNSYQYLIRSSPTSTLRFAAYVVNPDTTFVVVTDSNRVTAGSALMQH